MAYKEGGPRGLYRGIGTHNLLALMFIVYFKLTEEFLSPILVDLV